MKMAIRQFLVACMLLTRWPVASFLQTSFCVRGTGFAGEVQTDAPPPLVDTVWAWPLIGGAVGLVTGSITLLLFFMHVPLSLAVLWAIVFQLCLTGALHEDGLMDSCDGLFGGKTPARCLEIMRDSRIGSFGTIAFTVALLGKWSAYIAICRTLSYDIVQTLFAFAGAAAFSRWGMVLTIAGSRPARSDGVASALRLKYRDTVTPLLFALLFGFFVSVSASLVAVFLSVCVALLVSRYTEARVDGYTGDILGAVSIVTELAVLTVFCTMGRGMIGAL